MTDLAMLCAHLVASSGGLARVDLADLHRAMQRNINSSRDYVPAVELVTARASRR